MAINRASDSRKEPPKPPRQSVEEEEPDRPSEQEERAQTSVEPVVDRFTEPLEPSETEPESDFDPDVNSSRPDQ
jgi:hypothetical protein